MNIRVLLIYIAALAFLSACKSDPATSTTSNSNNALEVLPSTIHATRYTTVAVSARMNGVAQSDVYYTFDFGDGAGVTPPTGSQIEHFFLTPGTFTVTAKAFDRFRDTLLASTTVPAIVDDTIHWMSVTPHQVDTSVITTDSTLRLGILPPVFSAYSNSKYVSSVSIHVTTTGLDTVLAPMGAFSQPTLFRLGTYKIVYSAFDQANNLFGRDSATVTLRKR
ncbi:MAG: PKD domain-containing protein [Bacteroidetes bacterium]|nr:PKD domain-containing protein [Bacteroidota bacterium]